MHAPSGHSPADTLNEELEAAKTLLQVLEKEQDSLVKADIDVLAQLTEEKTELIALMTKLAQDRHSRLSAAGFQDQEAGMKAWLESKPAKATAKTAWNELLTLAKKAKEVNRTNGLLITQQMMRNQTALNVLQGNQPGGLMYGPDGQATAGLGSRRLVVG